MSLYSEYVKERQIDLIYETDIGFATYRYCNDGRTVYIVDIFVTDQYREIGEAARIADFIVAEAKAKGCSELWGTVAPQAAGSTTSLRVLLAYGMRLHDIRDGLIVFRKDI